MVKKIASNEHIHEKGEGVKYATFCAGEFLTIVDTYDEAVALVHQQPAAAQHNFVIFKQYASFAKVEADAPAEATQ